MMHSASRSPVAAADGVRVCALSDLADGSAIRVEIGGLALAVIRSGGEVFALDDVCSHAEVSLSDGDVAGGRVECWLHGSQFDLRTGRPCQRPATKPVRVFPVTIDGDDVLVRLEG